MASRDGPAMKLHRRTIVISENTMAPAMKLHRQPVHAGSSGPVDRGFSGFSRLALGQSQGGSHC
jgi:hypothetical protein